VDQTRLVVPLSSAGRVGAWRMEFLYACMHLHHPTAAALVRDTNGERWNRG
jgi:hypothetical protein